MRMVKVREDMTGWVMSEHGVSDSRLTVVCQSDDYVDKNGTHYAQWLCECNCPDHNRIIARGCHIRNGHIYSCGCFNKERISEIGRNKHKTNEYQLWLQDEHGLYGIGYCSNTGREFYFDMDNYNKIKDYNWYDDYGRGYHRVRAHSLNGNNKILMHHLLFEKSCDHKDRNAMNNRQYNIRKATPRENSINCKTHKNNTSGIIGVTWHKHSGKWVARINDSSNNRIVLGYFINKQDAIVARLNAEIEYYGEFAPQRHLFEQYDVIKKKAGVRANE